MRSIFDPEIPAGAYDQFIGQAKRISADQPGWTPDHGDLPAWYLGHGAPPLLDDGPWMEQLFGWAQSLPKPTGIVIVSAHWESAPLTVSAPAAHTPLVYDFGGFARRYYSLTYDTPDAGGLARRVSAMMPDTEPLYAHPRRGLDHGAWIPLMVMYPLADVPVLQMSIPTHEPHRLLEIGARLRSLRAEGVLVIGSGFLTHGLPFLTVETSTLGTVPGWSSDFDAWAGEALARGDVDTLADYRSAAPGMPYAHPTVEHFTPLFVTLGAGSQPDAPVATAIDGFQFGLSKRSFAVS